MLSEWLRASSTLLATLTGVSLAVSCSGTGSTDPAAASAASGATASGDHAGSAGAATSGGSTGSAGQGTGTVSTGGTGGTGVAAGGAQAFGGLGGAGMGSAGRASGRAGAAGSDGSAGAGTAGASGAAPTSGTVPASDTFDGTALDSSWSVFHPDLADVAVADGTLTIAPHSGALWYQTSRADLVYKLVTGNFKATTTVHARKASDRTQTPEQFADVGGIMARNASGSPENYVLGVVGYAEMNQLAVEHKSTTNGQSVYGEVAFTPDAEFRMCRVGSTFTIYYRAPGDSGWGPAFEPFERPDLPDTVQVGPIAYTGASAPDFVAIFDNFTFEPLGAGCTQ